MMIPVHLVKVLLQIYPMGKRIYALVKFFDKEEYADSFLSEGQMFCRKLSDFQEIEDEEVRGDREEGVSHWLQPPDIEISISGVKEEGQNLIVIKAEDLSSPVSIKPNYLRKLNIFCLYSIYIDDSPRVYSTEGEKKEIELSILDSIKISEKCQKFGDIAVVIHGVQSFIDRLVSYAKLHDCGLYANHVSYYDQNVFSGSFQGIDAIFNKNISYKYQNEYRVAFQFKNSSDAIMINLGNLSEIAFKTKTALVNELIKITSK